MADAQTTVTKAAEKLNEGEFDDLINFFSAGAVWSSDSLQGGSAQGPEAIVGALKALRAGFPELAVKIDPDSFMPSRRGGFLGLGASRDQVAAFQFTASGQNSKWHTNVGITKRGMRVTGSGWLTVDSDGLITRLTTFWNCGAVMAQLGMRSYARPGPVPAEPSPSLREGA